MSAVLETKALNKYFGAVVAAKDINISLESDERVGIIGANGAGKTTFINLVTGYLKPSWGKIFYQGKNITSLPSSKITRLGISRSFQIPQLFSELSVSNNLLIALGLSPKSHSSFFKPLLNRGNFEQVKQTLNRFDLQDDINVLAGILPQGKRKLLDIAMATVNDPQLILLDEPTSGISTEEKFAVMERLMETLDTTTLLIEHDMEVVESFCTRVIAFYEGEIIANGDVKEVLANERVKEYIVGKELHRKITQNNELKDKDTLDDSIKNKTKAFSENINQDEEAQDEEAQDEEIQDQDEEAQDEEIQDEEAQDENTQNEESEKA